MELVELIYQWLSTHKGKQDDILDALAFHIAGNEVAHKNMVPWLYTKIFSECNGDEKQLIASYIKIRHPQIREEIIRIFVFSSCKFIYLPRFNKSFRYYSGIITNIFI